MRRFIRICWGISRRPIGRECMWLLRWLQFKRNHILFQFLVCVNGREGGKGKRGGKKKKKKEKREGKHTQKKIPKIFTNLPPPLRQKTKQNKKQKQNKTKRLPLLPRLLPPPLPRRNRQRRPLYGWIRNK